MIKSVEELGAELDAVPFVLTELGVLEDSEVKVFHAVGANVRLGAGIGSVAVVRPVREYGGVKPVVEPVVQRTGSLMGQTGPDWACATRIGYAGVAERTRTAADDDREAALEGNDRIDPPTADQFVGDAVQIIGELLALAQG